MTYWQNTYISEGKRNLKRDGLKLLVLENFLIEKLV